MLCLSMHVVKDYAFDKIKQGCPGKKEKQDKVGPMFNPIIAVTNNSIYHLKFYTNLHHNYKLGTNFRDSI
jgi:hypothetical protein